MSGTTTEFNPQWVQKARQGDQDAIRALYQHAYRPVYLTIKSMLKGDEDTILDLVQDTFLKAFDNLGQLSDPNSFNAWIKAIARNQARDWLKKCKPVLFSALSSQDQAVSTLQLEDDDIYHLPEAVVDRQETARLVDDILDSLSESQRMAIGMFYYQDMSVKQVAREMGVRPGTVKALLSQGRQRIRSKVEELERQGTKLYGLSPVGFLLWTLRDCPVEPDDSILSRLLNHTGVDSTRQVAIGAGQAAANGVGQVAAAAAATAARAVAVKFISFLAVVTIVGGAAGGVIHLTAPNPTGKSVEAAIGSAVPSQKDPWEDPDDRQEPGDQDQQQQQEPSEQPQRPDDDRQQEPQDQPQDQAVLLQQDAGQEDPDGTGESLWNPGPTTDPDQNAADQSTAGGESPDQDAPDMGTAGPDTPGGDTSGENTPDQDAPEGGTTPDTPGQGDSDQEGTQEAGWNLSDDGVLIISGNGNMDDYIFGEDSNTQSGAAPWNPEAAKVKRVIITDGVTSIGDYAFFNCVNLTSVEIPDSVTSIGDSAFSQCTSLTDIALPQALTTIGPFTFQYCSSLSSISIPDSVISIEMFAFSHCSNLTSVSFPDSLQIIGQNAFSDCTKLTGIQLPSQLTSLGMWAFTSCPGLTSIRIPEGITTLGTSTFANCSNLTEVVLPDTLTAIQPHALSNCTSLTSITIPSGVTSIGLSAFSQCSALSEIHFTGDVPSLGSNWRIGCVPTIYYPADNPTWTQQVLTFTFFGLTTLPE